jgi:UDP-N-acetylmuramoylalanine-D-glutamate ligase
MAKVPIEFPQTLLLKLAPPITVLGVMGSCGKSTVASMTYSILKKAFSSEENQAVYSLDPDAPGSLSILKTLKKDDIIIARIPAPMAPAYHDARISPQVAVFTTFSSWVPDFMARTVSTILEFQTYNNFIIGSDIVIDQIREEVGIKPKAKMLRTRSASVPADWKIKYRGAYDRENVALALQVAELFKVPKDIVRDVLEAWTGLRGRLELVKKVQGIEFFNDSAAVSPTATLAGLRAVSENRNVTLIFGGAVTFESYDELIDNISQYAASVILVPGSGTLNIRRDMAMIKDLPCFSTNSIEEAVKLAREHAGRGEAVLFSPGFEARGIDISRRERGDRFVKAVRELK